MKPPKDAAALSVLDVINRFQLGVRLAVAK
jgi:hypothetical protein